MPVFDVPIIPAAVADAFNGYLDGEFGLGPKVACPERRSKIVRVAASSMDDAAMLAEKSNPNWVALRRQILKSRHA